VIDLVNFKLIPVDTITDYIFGTDDDNSTTTDDAKSLRNLSSNGGFKSTNMLKNLGFVLFGLAALVVVILIVLLMRMLMNRIPIIKRIYTVLN
jgi:uncharacterized membrane protein